jgi:predicted transcriptional regulator
MSMDLMVKAMKIKVGNPLRKLVLLKLADNASDLGECWPSFNHIAEQCEISRRSVISHIDALCEMGLLSKEYRSGVKGNSSNLYVINFTGAGDSPGSANSSLPVQQFHHMVQEIHQGVVQEMHPESVTLLNQSKNQS